MSIIDTLIMDRNESDLSALRSLLAVPFDQWTAEQKEQFKLSMSKGAYNASDLNRVNEACLYLAYRFREYGYQVDVKLPTITDESGTRNQWEIGDIPQKHHMEEYLQNINNLRSSLELASSAPETPSDMDSLTIQEANDIEAILFAIHDVLTRVFAAFLRSGQFTFWSGNRPMPTGNTDVGRTWSELDAMNTEWNNWQVATWYLLLYGNLQAEGVV